MVRIHFAEITTHATHMKYGANVAVTLLVLLTLGACDSMSSMKPGSGSEPAFMELVVISDGLDEVVDRIRIPLDRQALSPDTLFLVNGASYRTRIDLIDAGGRVIRNLDQRAEEIEFRYAIDGIQGLLLEVLDKESTYNRNTRGFDLDVGLLTSMALTLEASPRAGQLSITYADFGTEKDGHFPTDSQIVSEVTLPIAVRQLETIPDMPRVTRVVVHFASQDGSQSIDADVSLDASGMGGSTGVIGLFRNQRYDGSFDLYGENGLLLNDAFDAQSRFLVFSVPPFDAVSASRTLSMDDNGNPYGRTFSINTPSFQGSTSGAVFLNVYDSNRGHDKAILNSSAYLLTFDIAVRFD